MSGLHDLILSYACTIILASTFVLLFIPWHFCCALFEEYPDVDLFFWLSLQWILQFLVVLRVRWLLWQKEHPEFCWWVRLGMCCVRTCRRCCLSYKWTD